jgi:surfactin synthase thioesterase subunit
MKVAYLHGLESSINEQDPKIQFLRKEFHTAYTPSIDYSDPATFTQVLSQIRQLRPTLLIGSSAGGYLAYLIGRATGIPTLLFNPAVVNRSFSLNTHITPTYPTHHTLWLGAQDTTIPGASIIDWLDHNSTDPRVVHQYPAGHRVPASTFISSIQEWIRSHHSFLTE